MRKTKEKFVNKIYKLTRERAPLSYMLPTRNTKRYPLLWFDEESGENKALRYARNQKSPFEDEQDGNILLDPIVFEDGFLSVPKNNQVLQRFLEIHPLNGFQFEEVNTERDAAAELEVIGAEADALIAARELTIDEAETISKVLFGKDTSRLTSAEIKRDLLVFAKNEPEEFLNILDDPMINLQGLVQTFFDEGVLIMKKKGEVHFNTKSNKKRMLVVPPGEDRLFIIATFLQSDDGVEALKLLEKVLEKLDEKDDE